MLCPPTHTPNHANAVDSHQKLYHHTRSTPRPQRRGNPTHGAAGGPGVQAVFLGSSKKSLGTGVFLPRRRGTDFQFNNNSACSPVLIPSRVVQTLDLNVHELGQHIFKPHQDLNKANDCSPEIVLPKEWTY
ncbi:unnamed protein product [Fraxinus pennsylvanica]|uniref:Uncharacterized protein n=1 Tax=Fraxinus pennsylvanica TaxID=56036 RepID=A0AAD2DV91_9LAMI|nr:unnamed protein product [Fraxinus pennsylvanica]